MTESLGRLERVELRDVWANEAGDFTPWLGREDNLKLLGEAIGLELELEAQEREVGAFSADLLCRDLATENWVLVENQLEATDHTHLGQLMTYAAGLNAVTIVWVASRFREEHRAAIDWLNEITDDGFNFFGLEVEVWRIGESQPAPKFNAIAKPNEWSRSVKQTASAAGLTETRQLQLAYWTAFKEFAGDQASFRVGKPQPQHWMSFGMGRSGIHLSAVASTWDSDANRSGGESRAELVMVSRESKEQFEALIADRKDVEAVLGEPLTWYNPDNARVCRIYVRRAANIEDKDDWPSQHKWLLEKLEKLRSTFADRIAQL